MQTPNRFIIFLKQIWPTIYRVVNAIFYFLLSSFKNFVIRAIEQIKS